MFVRRNEEWDASRSENVACPVGDTAFGSAQRRL